MKIVNMKYLILIVVFMGSTWATSVQAVPSFARDTGKNCSYCHNAWPQLNKKGRSFKELGYRIPKDGLMSFKAMAEERAFPVSAVIVARPYDRKDKEKDDSSVTKVRALHEVEVLVAGAIGKYWSGFFELEAEDEDLNARGFELGVPAAVLSYNHSKPFNIQLSWGAMMYSDPYGFIGDHFRLTRGHAGFIDKKYGGADGSLRSSRQNITVTGRLIDRIFYSAGLSGEADDAEGVEAGTIHGRLAFDITKDIMVGGFIVGGTVEPVAASSSTVFVECTGLGVPEPSCASAGDVAAVTTTSAAIEQRDYQRLGIDAQADFGNTRVQFAYVAGSDDTKTAGIEEDNDNISIQAFHVMKTSTGKPTWVPLIRFDSYESKNGTVSNDDVTLNLTRYFEHNIKGYIEYWNKSAQESINDEERLTVQIMVGF